MDTKPIMIKDRVEKQAVEENEDGSYDLAVSRRNCRFIYIRKKVDNECYYFRVTRKWYRPIMFLGQQLKRVIYLIHTKLSKKRNLTEKDYQEAKRLANEMVSEEEYLRRFASINPYCQKGWSTILWWIRENITFD